MKELSNKWNNLKPQELADVERKWKLECDELKARQDHCVVTTPTTGEYPLPASVLSTIVDHVVPYADAFVKRTGSECVSSKAEEFEVRGPWRLCGHVYGAGRCRDELDVVSQEFYHLIHATVLKLTLYERPAKDDLDGIVKHMRMFKFA